MTRSHRILSASEKLVISDDWVVICSETVVNKTHLTAVFRFKRRWRSLQDGNSCSERRGNSGGWRRFWSFSFYWTRWERTASGRSLNGPMLLVRLCSLRLTSHPWMSFTNWWDLIGTMMSGMRLPVLLLFKSAYVFNCSLCKDIDSFIVLQMGIYVCHSSQIREYYKKMVTIVKKNI